MLLFDDFVWRVDVLTLSTTDKYLSSVINVIEAVSDAVRQVRRIANGDEKEPGELGKSYTFVSHSDHFSTRSILLQNLLRARFVWGKQARQYHNLHKETKRGVSSGEEMEYRDGARYGVQRWSPWGEQVGHDQTRIK